MNNYKKEPLISVIIDNYNYGHFLSQSVDSVLNQTYKNSQIIIVDDGSTDNSREIIERYARVDSRITPVFKKNGGQMSAFNTAYRYVEGDIVAFLDSDDYWYLNKLEKILVKHRDYQVVQHYLSKNGRGCYRRVNANVDWHNILMEYGYLYNHSVCSSLSFDSALLSGFFPFSNEEEMVYCADGVLLMMALSVTRIGFVEEELGFYRIHGDNGFVGKTDYGESARNILYKQHKYVNKQLKEKGMDIIPFDKYAYFEFLLNKMNQEGVIDTTDRILLYGTESSGLYMTHCLRDMEFDVVGYIDSDKKKWGKLFCEKRIFSPKEIEGVLKGSKRIADKIIIASSAQYEISRTLIEYGLVKDKDFFTMPI